MNLQPVQIENLPIGRPLTHRLYDNNGYIVFARGEMVTSREQLERLIAAGLFLDRNAPPQTRETGDWAEFSEIAPIGIFPPSGIKPQIGELVQLHLPNQNPHGYHSARLIGYIKNQSILLTRPEGQQFIAVEGELTEVRMMTGTHIHAFRVAIQRLCISPSQYMHLEYPLEVRTQKLRKSPWARTNLGITVTDKEGAHEAARLVNLSADGGQLHASPALGTPGEKLTVILHAAMDELKSTLSLDATILHVHALGQAQESNLLEYGVSFDNVSAADTLWLKALVYRHIAEGDIA